MNTETPQLVISRVFDAPRELVYRAFTDPDHLAAWWGPISNSLPRDEIVFHVRPGGYQWWTEANAADTLMNVQAVAANHREERHGKADLRDERVA